MCGQLVPISLLSRLSAVKSYLHLLEAPGFTRQERHKASDKIHEYPLAMDHSCQQICNSCCAALYSGKIPRNALTRGLWLGQVPEVLLNLCYVEKMLVAKIRHSSCAIRVASQMRKMKAHAISYQQPVPKVYNVLPPPKVDIEDVLAIYHVYWPLQTYIIRLSKNTFSCETQSCKTCFRMVNFEQC